MGSAREATCNAAETRCGGSRREEGPSDDETPSSRSEGQANRELPQPALRPREHQVGVVKATSLSGSRTERPRSMKTSTTTNQPDTFTPPGGWLRSRQRWRSIGLFRWPTAGFHPASADSIWLYDCSPSCPSTIRSGRRAPCDARLDRAILARLGAPTGRSAESVGQRQSHGSAQWQASAESAAGVYLEAIRLEMPLPYCLT